MTLSTNRALKTPLGRDGHLVHAHVADVHVPFQRYGVHAGEVVVVQRGSFGDLKFGNFPGIRWNIVFFLFTQLRQGYGDMLFN